MLLKFELNKKQVSINVAPEKRLLDVLRDDFDLIGTKEGCGEGECGACTVIMEGKAVNSCLLLAAQAQGKKIITVEGLSQNGVMDPLQLAFIENHAVQCGFCTAGMLMSAKALVMENSNPDDEEIRNALAGNLCRCTGYNKIIGAVKMAVKTNQQTGEKSTR